MSRAMDLETKVARLTERVERLEAKAGLDPAPRVEEPAPWVDIRSWGRPQAPAPEAPRPQQRPPQVSRPQQPRPQARRPAPKPPATRPERPVARPEPPATRREAPVARREPPATRREAPAARPEPRLDLEDLVGGKVLAWIGGLAVVLGLVFLFAVAVSNGWIGEGMRTLFGAAASAGLLGLGIWLHERKARTDAALASVSAGIAGLFVTVTVAAQVYELVPGMVGLVLGLATGALATALAVSWDSRGIAALGIVGALIAPLLAGAEADGGTLTLLFVAGSSAVGVLLWKRWDWLALAVFAIVTPQWVGWLLDGASLGGGLLALCAFGALGVGAAVGYELRLAAAGLRLSSSFLLTLNAIVLGLAGYAFLADEHGGVAGGLWLVVLALIHLAVGFLGSANRRISHELELLALVLGVVLADVAFGLLASGPVLALGWAGSGVGFAALMRHASKRKADAVLAQLGLGVHVSLALLHTLATVAQPAILSGEGTLTAAGTASLVGLAAACLVSGRLTQEQHPEWRLLLDVLGLSVVAYLTALSLDGPMLALAWSAEAIALAHVARLAKDDLAAWAVLAHIAGALGVALIHVAPFESLESGLADPLGAALALVAVAAACLLSGRVVQDDHPEWRAWLDALSVASLAYLLALLLDGAMLALAWSAAAVVLAFAARLTKDEVPAWAALAHIAGALGVALVHVAPPESLVYGLPDSAEAALALVAASAACLVCGRIMLQRHPEWRAWLEAVGIAGLAYLAALLLDGPMLALAWSAAALVLAQVARQTEDEVPAWAALAHVAGALSVALIHVAQPDSLVYGLSAPLDAAVALGAPAVAALVIAEMRIGRTEWPPVLTSMGAVVLLYLASAAVVTPFQPGNAELEPVLDLDVRQQGQMVLSVFWAAIGLSALVLGLRRDLRAVRLGALALLLGTIAKVFLFDLATLTSVYRVVSFLGLGLLLLVGAAVWQRLRPRDLPDLRETPEGVR